MLPNPSVEQSAYLILPKATFKLNSVTLGGGHVLMSGRKAHLCQQSHLYADVFYLHN